MQNIEHLYSTMKLVNVTPEDKVSKDVDFRRVREYFIHGW